MPLDTTTRMLAPFLDRLTDEELDAIPYGVVRLDKSGQVLSCNRAEADNAGLTGRPLGRHFFTEVYPSANVPEFHDRVMDGVQHGRLDATFSFTFSCDLMPRRVLVRAYYAGRTDSVWLFFAKPDGSPFDLSPAPTPSIRPTPSHGIDLRTSRVA
ncbi:MAG: hypothetical protein IBJ19_07925 [Gemmatimonadaceae bacterium]|nr:hypothetical protein [Gemmatimonadaceae bacterium]